MIDGIKLLDTLIKTKEKKNNFIKNDIHLMCLFNTIYMIISNKIQVQSSISDLKKTIVQSLSITKIVVNEEKPIWYVYII
ncbi:hypothetical protein E2986_11393 [Frieseomelitta varia]|uniref:Uncharacterized protein n=1 Tax=Frieseomelitta varia TaxID=561572 RepID=A0A833W0H7_9HYME|nr:hypothetical protein E2986_11393 [Frieseomelitta varia]